MEGTESRLCAGTGKPLWSPCMVVALQFPCRTLRVAFLQAVINHCNTSAVKSVPCILALQLRPRSDFIGIFHVCKHFIASFKPFFLEATFVSNYHVLKTLTFVDDGAANITTKERSCKINVTNRHRLCVKQTFLLFAVVNACSAP